MAKISFEFVGDNKQLLQSIEEIKTAMAQINSASGKLGVSADEVIKGLSQNMSAVTTASKEVDRAIETSQTKMDDMGMSAADLDTKFRALNLELRSWTTTLENMPIDAPEEEIKKVSDRIEEIKAQIKDLRRQEREAFDKSGIPMEITTGADVEMVSDNGTIAATPAGSPEQLQEVDKEYESIVEKVNSLTSGLDKSRESFNNLVNAPHNANGGDFLKLAENKEKLDAVDERIKDVDKAYIECTGSVSDLVKKLEEAHKSGNTELEKELTASINGIADKMEPLKKEAKELEEIKNKILEESEAIRNSQNAGASTGTGATQPAKQSIWAQFTNSDWVQNLKSPSKAMDSIKDSMSAITVEAGNVAKGFKMIGKGGASSVAGLEMMKKGLQGIGKQLLQIMKNPYVALFGALLAVIMALGEGIKKFFTETSDGAKIFAKIKGDIEGVKAVIDNFLVNLGRNVVALGQAMKHIGGIVNGTKKLSDFFSWEGDSGAIFAATKQYSESMTALSAKRREWSKEEAKMKEEETELQEVMYSGGQVKQMQAIDELRGKIEQRYQKSIALEKEELKILHDRNVALGDNAHITELQQEAEQEAKVINLSSQKNREMRTMERRYRSVTNAIAEYVKQQKKAIDELNFEQQKMVITFAKDTEISDLQNKLKYEKDFNKQLELEDKIRALTLQKEQEQIELERKRQLENVRAKTKSDIQQKYGADEANYFEANGNLGKYDDPLGIVSNYNQQVELTNRNFDTKSYQAEEKSRQQSAQAQMKKDIDDYTEYVKEIVDLEQWKQDQLNKIASGEDVGTSKEQVEKEYNYRLNAAKENRGIDTAEEESTGIVSKFIGDIQGAASEQINIALEALETSLTEQETALASNRLLSEEERLAQTAKIESIRKQAKQIAKQAKDKAGLTAKRSEEDIKKLNKRINASVQSLQAVKDMADDVANTFGEALNKKGKKALETISSIASTAMSGINSISSLVSGVTNGFQTTVAAAVAAMSSMEKASVILTILSAAVQIITAIVNIASKYTASAMLQEAIDEQKEKVEELEREHDKLERQYKNSVGVEYYKGLADQADDYNKLLDANNEALSMAQKLYQMQAANYGKDSDKAKDAKEQVEELEDATNEYIDAQEELRQEIADTLLTTNATDFASSLADSMVEAFEDGTQSIENVWDNTLKDLEKAMMKQALSNALASMFDKTFQEVAKKVQDGTLTQADMDSAIDVIAQQSEKAKEISEEWYKAMEERDLLTEDDASGGSGAFTGMSQDTADELNGRFTALQMSGINILAVNTDMRTLLAEQFPLINSTLNQLLSGNTIALEVADSQLDQLRIIAANTALLNETNRRLQNIELNTNGL